MRRLSRLSRNSGSSRVGSSRISFLANLTPEEAAISVALMLPAMNVEDRVELLGGMRANAPAEAFAAVWNHAGSVLTSSDRDATAVRLGIA